MHPHHHTSCNNMHNRLRHRCSQDGNSLLHHASLRSDDEAAALLLSFGADPNAANSVRHHDVMSAVCTCGACSALRFEVSFTCFIF